MSTFEERRATWRKSMAIPDDASAVETADRILDLLDEWWQHYLTDRQKIVDKLAAVETERDYLLAEIHRIDIAMDVYDRYVGKPTQ